MKLTAVYVQQGDWIAAWIEEIPGVNTQGATLEEARENLRDALDMMLETEREKNERQNVAALLPSLNKADFEQRSNPATA